MVDLAKSLLDKLKRAFESAASVSMSSLNSLANVVSTHASHFSESQLRGVVQADTKKYFDELAVVKRASRYSDLDIGECLAGDEDELQAIPDTYGRASHSLVQKKMSDSLTAIYGVKAEIAQSSGTIVQLTKELKTCVCESPSTLKVGALILRISSETLNIPYKISRATLKVSKSVACLPDAASKIVVEQTREATTAAERIMLRVTKCVERKKAEQESERAWLRFYPE